MLKATAIPPLVPEVSRICIYFLNCRPNRNNCTRHLSVARLCQEAEVTVESEDSLTCSRGNQQFFDKCEDRSHEKKRPRNQEPSNCKHGMIMSKCAVCRSSSTCPHGKKQKSKCRECWGSSICIHRRQTHQCKECGGSSICPHGRIKSQCKECGGSSICPHGRIKSTCKECGGSSICLHGRIKYRCLECQGMRVVDGDIYMDMVLAADAACAAALESRADGL